MRVHLTCSTCGAPLVRTPATISKRNYCSRACNAVGKRNPAPPIVLSEDGLTATVALDESGSAYATIDAADAEWAQQWRWRLLNNGYVCRRETVNGRRKAFLLHREILGLVAGDGLEGDHLNRNRQDCRRSNLRIIPKLGRGNAQNCPSQGGTSSYRGVDWLKGPQKWQARARVSGKVYYAGRFDNEDEAGAAAKALRLKIMSYAVD